MDRILGTGEILHLYDRLDERLTVQYWYDLLTRLNFECITERFYNDPRYKYEKCTIYINAIFINEDRTTRPQRFRFIYDDFKVDLHFSLSDAEDIELFIRAVKDHSLLPLCLGINWAAEIVSALLKSG